MPMQSGQEVLRWMTKAYECAEQGDPEETFYCWERAYKAAGPAEKVWLETKERRPLVNSAYEVSARHHLHHAQRVYNVEMADSLQKVPFPLYELRRLQRVEEWNTALTQARDHALEIPHQPLLVCIAEARKHPLRPLWRSRIKKLCLLS